MSYLGAQPAPLATQLDDNVVNTNNIVAGAVETTDIANAAVTSDKLASGAAASNLGNYVSTVNGSTGAVTVQPTLVSGTTIKTVNSTSLLGSGDVAVQPTLVSGSNIKTINSESLLGSGNISISGGLQLDTNTSTGATDYAIGTYVWVGRYLNAVPALNGSQTLYTWNGWIAATTTANGSLLSGTWRRRGDYIDIGGVGGGDWGNLQPWFIMQRTA